MAELGIWIRKVTNMIHEHAICPHGGTQLAQLACHTTPAQEWHDMQSAQTECDTQFAQISCQTSPAQEWCDMQSVQTECCTQRDVNGTPTGHRLDTDGTPGNTRSWPGHTGEPAPAELAEPGPAGSNARLTDWFKRSLDRAPGSNGTGKPRWRLMECSLQPQCRRMKTNWSSRPASTRMSS